MTTRMAIGARFIRQFEPRTVIEGVGLSVGDPTVWCAVPR